MCIAVHVVCDQNNKRSNQNKKKKKKKEEKERKNVEKIKNQQQHRTPNRFKLQFSLCILLFVVLARAHSRSLHLH